MEDALLARPPGQPEPRAQLKGVKIAGLPHALEPGLDDDAGEMDWVTVQRGQFDSHEFADEGVEIQIGPDAKRLDAVVEQFVDAIAAGQAQQNQIVLGQRGMEPADTIVLRDIQCHAGIFSIIAMSPMPLKYGRAEGLVIKITFLTSTCHRSRQFARVEARGAHPRCPTLRRPCAALRAVRGGVSGQKTAPSMHIVAKIR